MKKILILIIGVLFLIGCSSEFKPIKCDYCHGYIYWHKTKAGLVDEYYQQYKDEKDGKYHYWCWKIKNKIKGAKN